MRPFLGTLLALCGLLSACGLGTRTSGDTGTLDLLLIGDAEPKPDPIFAGLEAAVAYVEARPGAFDLALGVGDLVHRGTMEQYLAARPLIRRLPIAFHAIMGNEEHTAGLERFLEQADLWDDSPATVPAARYTIQAEGVPIVLASASVDGRELSDSDIDWILERLDEVQEHIAILVTHGAWAGVFGVEAEKGIRNPRFLEVLAHPSLAVVVSGDLHIDIDSHTAIAITGNVVHIHVPPLERTKVGTEHTPRLRVLRIGADHILAIERIDLDSGKSSVELTLDLDNLPPSVQNTARSTAEAWPIAIQ